jgi:uncharacterized membrane protein YeaQ/YmgE (transglycosylase-associated protein family)
MEILWILLFGLIAGALGKLLMPGDDPGGILATIVIGVMILLGLYRIVAGRRTTDRGHARV